jgi:hypothetical protein
MGIWPDDWQAGCTPLLLELARSNERRDVMAPAILILAGLAILGVAYLLFSKYWKLRGARLVTCPETGAPTGVEVKMTRAVASALVGQPNFRLKDCSRWPERRHCGQECLRQIEAAPQDCLVRTILTNWYEGRSCVLCGKPLGEVDWLEHKPALMDLERRTVEWRDVRAERLPQVLDTHMPICWNCHIAESFRRQFPDLVVDRPWKSGVHQRNT